MNATHFAFNISVRYPIFFYTEFIWRCLYNRSSVRLSAYHFYYLFIFIKRTLNSCWLYANIPPYVRIFTEIYGRVFFAYVCVLMFRFCFTSICHIFKLIHRKTVHQRTGNRKQTKRILFFYICRWVQWMSVWVCVFCDYW